MRTCITMTRVTERGCREETEDLEDLAQVIIEGPHVPRPAHHLYPTRSAELLSLVDQALTHEASCRPSLAALLATPLIQQVC